MLAFEESAELGFRHFETDLHLSKDGVLVAFHDDTLDRVTEGSGRVSDYTVAELQRFDAAFRFGSNREWPYRGQGITIPTLEEVVVGLPDSAFTLELKEAGLAGPLARFMERNDLWDRVIVGSYTDEWLAEVRRLTRGRALTSSGRHETFRFWLASRAGWALQTPAVALQVPVRYGRITVVDGRFLEAAHRAGKHVHVWTIDDPAEMRRLLDLGVDGLMSDRPDLLLTVLGPPVTA